MVCVFCSGSCFGFALPFAISIGLLIMPITITITITPNANPQPLSNCKSTDHTATVNITQPRCPPLLLCCYCCVYCMRVNVSLHGIMGMCMCMCADQGKFAQNKDRTCSLLFRLACDVNKNKLIAEVWMSISINQYTYSRNLIF